MAIALTTIRYHNEETPYHYTYDNQPLSDLEANDLILKAAIETLQNITFVQTAIPIILVPNGTVSTAGVVTLGTALPTIYANAWIRLPAGAITGGLAGLYYCTFTSTTVGQVYTNYSDPAAGVFTPTIPTSPINAVGSNAAYTQTTASQLSLLNVSIPANSLGANGALRYSAQVGFPNNANSKTPRFQYGGVTLTDLVATTSVAAGHRKTIRNRGNAAINFWPSNNLTSEDGSLTTNTYVYGTVNTAVAQAFTFSGQLATATDYIVLEGFTIELLPKA